MMNSQTHKFYIRRMVLVFSTLLLSFLTASALSAMNNADANRNKVADFDGDGKSDISVFRPSNGFWYIMKSSGGFSSVQWGQKDDSLVPGDYDGDGKTDVAVYRFGFIPGGGETNTWHIRRSSDNTSFARPWGRSGGSFETPVPADYNGDGKIDLAVYFVSDVFPDSGGYRILQSSTDSGVYRQWGFNVDRRVQADYDGDGKADLAVFRYNSSTGSTEAGIWYILQSSNGAMRIEYFGLPTDKLVPADYDGDGMEDIAVFRPSNGFWYILKSTGGVSSTHFGISTDIPVPGDYDGDGKDDIAVFRNGNWFINRSTGGFFAVSFGDGSDVPIPKQYIP